MPLPRAPPILEGRVRTRRVPVRSERGRCTAAHESALADGASLIVSALGTPPAEAASFAHEQGVKVGAMVVAARHAPLRVEADVDLIIAQGGEAAAHAGDITTMVLVPEIVDQVAPRPVLAAGGIATGRQIIAARSLGPQGGWTALG
jgi:NAD(P)H-dependent flavin oxidoreductase YrpB (nitropropane dioxygenase family)